MPRLRYAAFTLLLVAAPAFAEPRLEYNRDIRPILANNCFKCHGADARERKASLRLDIRDEAIKPADSGRIPINPGKPDGSGVINRIFSPKADRVMPPPENGKTLTAEQKQTLRRWIAEGAEYQPHWAFIPPRRPTVPGIGNPIDAFVEAKRKAAGLIASPEADRVTLIRRLTLDLTGLPPTPKEVDDYLADQKPGAYERVVERLLNSQNYGERMALEWLDVARYADTHGYHLDSGRDMWRWRDWVIDSFNNNLPYDQFTIEQLAGDLLPGATLDQRIASGFNRNHMINFEGGAIPKEYHNAYIVDRVNTTGTAWLGLTIACAQCHDHKYDPITQKEYYQLYAYFFNVPENGLDGSKGNAAPLLKAPTLAQQAKLDELSKKIVDLEKVGKDGQEKLKVVRAEKSALEKQIPTSMVMEDMQKPRETFLLIRGQYDKQGEKVVPAVPKALGAKPQSARNRLELARWLVDPGNPLTARVAVNRYWQMFFGVGLVKTSEDLGTQGELPTHPELLDWLAVEWVTPSDPKAKPWDVKRLVRMIVTSATYRQTSAVSKEAYQRDPENRLLARGSRFRLQAEFVRDLAMSTSGLLTREIGGPSVFPYQPGGLWRELTERQDSKNWSAQFYVQSKGKDLYRRGMYTFWKRTSPPPTMTTFDAPDRETCTVRRSRTNTPLQALVLMNDPTFVEASRKLAERLMNEAKTIDERIVLAIRLTTSRRPTEREQAVLRKMFEEQLAVFRKDDRAALKLLSVGESKRDEKLDQAELAAWAMIANVVLNLDETLTRN
jgi:hypothetical protein